MVAFIHALPLRPLIGGLPSPSDASALFVTVVPFDASFV
ncbi:hypothetical protein SOVF_164930 isoform A [Spinacia oleracea]|nr:hypothetical protein SOVF_164930 isoform A [Spinacia oleracea]